MAKRRSIYACSECGAQQPRWLGRCPDCGAWDSLVEEPLGGKASGGGLVGAGPGLSGEPTPLSEIQPDSSPRIQTGEPELDRVLGGGLVPGSVTLLGGEPGVGKSTLAQQ